MQLSEQQDNPRLEDRDQGNMIEMDEAILTIE